MKKHFRNSSIKRKKRETNSESEDEFFDALSVSNQDLILLEQRKRRTEIQPKLNNSSFKVLFSILKNAIGKDLTRMPFPATFFSEPISFLQRHTEFLEYSSLLDKAAQCSDSLEQMTLVAAFSVSIFNMHCDRITKPFNPLLNETFEFDRREDFKWRAFSEQISHHPPKLALVVSHF